MLDGFDYYKCKVLIIEIFRYANIELHFHYDPLQFGLNIQFFFCMFFFIPPIKAKKRLYHVKRGYTFFTRTGSKGEFWYNKKITRLLDLLLILKCSQVALMGAVNRKWKYAVEPCIGFLLFELAMRSFIEPIKFS